LTVALLKLRPFEAVPVIIVISLAVAILLIDALTTLVNHLSSGPPPPEMLFRP